MYSVSKYYGIIHSKIKYVKMPYELLYKGSLLLLLVIIIMFS